MSLTLGGTDPIGLLMEFYKTISKPLPLKFSLIFGSLSRCGRFPVSWPTANVTPIPNESASVLPDFWVNDFQSLHAGYEQWLVSLDFSSAFDLVNHKASLFKFKKSGASEHVFKIISE